LLLQLPLPPPLLLLLPPLGGALFAGGLLMLLLGGGLDVFGLDVGHLPLESGSDPSGHVSVVLSGGTLIMLPGIVISGNEKFKLYNSEQPLAERLALFLTEMVRDPKLRQEIIAYRDNRKSMDEHIFSLDRTLGIFIKGVKLHTRKLGGTCYQCTTAK
jgi:hypothetical protein